MDQGISESSQEKLTKKNIKNANEIQEEYRLNMVHSSMKVRPLATF